MTIPGVLAGVLVWENNDARTNIYVQSDIDTDNNDQVSERRDRMLEKRDKIVKKESLKMTTFTQENINVDSFRDYCNQISERQNKTEKRKRSNHDDIHARRD